MERLLHEQYRRSHLWQKRGVLCVITSRSFSFPSQYRSHLEAVLEAQPHILQLREKDLEGRPIVTDRVFYEEGLWLKEQCRRRGIMFIVDDRLDMAMALDADGIHLGRKDLPLSVARRLWKKRKIYGVSVGNLEEAEKAIEAGATYLGFGAVFPTSTKGDTWPNSLQTLEDLCRAVSLPVLAIGGIGVKEVPQVISRGAWGVAVVSAVWNTPDPGEALRTLRSLL